jgi:hypothetical protein
MPIQFVNNGILTQPRFVADPATGIARQVNGEVARLVDVSLAEQIQAEFAESPACLKVQELRGKVDQLSKEGSTLARRLARLGLDRLDATNDSVANLPGTLARIDAEEADAEAQAGRVENAIAFLEAALADARRDAERCLDGICQSGVRALLGELGAERETIRAEVAAFIGEKLTRLVVLDQAMTRLRNPASALQKAQAVLGS